MSFLRKMFGAPNIEDLEAKRDIRGLLKLYNEGKQEALGSIAGVGDEMGLPYLIDSLIQLFDDKDKDIRNQAIFQVINFGGEDKLIAALGNENDNIRLGAISGLLSGGESTFNATMQALNDKDWRIRQTAAVILGEMDNVRAIYSLEEALNDESEPVRQSAAAAYAKIKSKRELVEILTQDLDEQTLQLLKALDEAHVTTANIEKADKAIQKLIGLLLVHLDIYPQSKEVFIRKAVHLAYLSDLHDRLKAFLLLTIWSGDDPKVDKAITDIKIPQSAL